MIHHGDTENTEVTQRKSLRSFAFLALSSLLLVLAATSAAAQTPYLALKPGQSTKDEVTRVLGDPVKRINEYMLQYPPQQGTGAIYVEFKARAPLVNRIEVYLAQDASRQSLVTSLELSACAEAGKPDSKGRLIEYFGAPHYITLTHVASDATSVVSRIGYFSEELYNIALGKRSSPAAANNPNNQQPPPPPPPAQPKYEDVIAKARGALQAQDYQNAVRLAQQAVGIDPAKADAYEIMGIAQLYGFKDMGAAETAMRAAVERGGAASFGVTHDHDGFFQTYCQGTLYINKRGASFRGNDGAHAFSAYYKDIKEVGLNNVVGSSYYAFHIKVVENGKTKNYNFAPGTLNAAETNLILGLLRNP